MSDSNLIPSPNYTQCPNVLFDYWLPILGFGELKVFMVIIRKTIGWHKQRDRICNKQLERYTGLSFSNIQTAVSSLMDRGLICKEVEGPNGKQEIFYSLIIKESYTPPVKGTPPPTCYTPPPTTGTTKESNAFFVSHSVAPSSSSTHHHQNKAPIVDDDENLKDFNDLLKALEKSKDTPEFSKPCNRAALLKLSKNYSAKLVGQIIFRFTQEKPKLTNPMGWLTEQVKEEFELFKYKQREAMK